MASTVTNPQLTPGLLRNGLWIKKIPSYYCASQVSSWLSCIGFRPHFSEFEIAQGLFPISLENLTVLMRLHLVSFPFENTSMHYTPEHRMDVSPAGIYERMVVQRKGGSYCFGQNGLLLGMLRGLGYRSYPGAARVNAARHTPGPPEFGEFSHMILFVQPILASNETYVVDVGFGGSNLARPILLSDDHEWGVAGAAPPERHRLTRGAHPSSSLGASQDSSDIEDLEWRLELWHGRKQEDAASSGWRILYMFSENEFFLPDFFAGSHAVSTMPGIFWNNIMCVKYFLADNEGSDAHDDHVDSSLSKEQNLGRFVMMGPEVKRHIGTRSEIIRTLSTEVERIQALRGIFGIHVQDEAAVHIEGREAALPI